MFAVSSVRSLSNFWNRAKWDFLMQNEAIQFWQWVCGKFLSLWPNVYYWWINICWTTSWQIFCRLIAANKYLALQIISPTNDVQVKNIWIWQNIFWWKKISSQLLHITLVLRYFYSVLFFENQVSIELCTPGKMFRHGMAGFSSREFSRMANTCRRTRSHMSRWTGRSVCK